MRGRRGRRHNIHVGYARNGTKIKSGHVIIRVLHRRHDRHARHGLMSTRKECSIISSGRRRSGEREGGGRERKIGSRRGRQRSGDSGFVAHLPGESHLRELGKSCR